VSATDPECGTNSPVTYKMARMQAPPREFKVNPTTGEVCVQSELDYEVASSYQFQVEATDTDGLSTQAVVQVEITDFNDNQPRFEPREYPINVLLGSPPAQLVTVQARDRDSGLIGTGAISVKRSLPEGMYTLKVLATDGGGLTSPDPGLVTVSVISGNVHPPIFTPTMFNFTISEDVPVGKMVGQVQANMDDTGGNMEISYSSLFQTLDWFNIDNRTGSIFTKSKLDRETSPFVVISIQAKAGFPPVYAVAQVNVTILDVNDNEPIFPATTLQVLPLYVARAHDKDTGNNGTIRYRLHNEPSDTFTINEQTGQLNLTRQLDYERHREYLLLVVAEDLGTPVRLSSNMTLTVKVKDINDNPPKFDRAVYDFSVAENVPIGQPIDRVIATDDDSEHNKRISFSLKNNRYDSVFGISPIEGIIWTRDVLDRELREMYELVVEAVDHGSPAPMTATAQIRILVTDVNDNDPVFTREEYRFSIRENLESSSLVGQVVAHDKDSGKNGQLQFFFAGPQTNFTINSVNGEIRTQVSLDREVIAEHVITVYVSDKGDNPRTAVTKVKIKVKDDNDNDPTFQRQGPVSVSIAENRPKGTDAVTLVAVDPDEGDNGLVSYFFDKDRSEAAALASFEIHPRSGLVSTREVLDYETQTIYHLTVVARDNGKQFRQNSQSLTISVLDTNDQAPLFHARDIHFDCVENVSIGTVVGQVKATDKDSGENGKVNYYLVGGNVFSCFSVDRVSGIIITVREVDFEEASSHFLSIQAIDSSTALPRSSNISVTIDVIDINDNAPVFEQDPVIIRTVAENTPRNHIVHKFNARDKDSGINGTVRYSIETYSGQEDKLGPYFDINRETGEMFVVGIIDFEKVDQISVIVKAEDACPFKNHVQHSLMTTIVFVTDVNDNPPAFESTSNLVVSEEEAIGYMILAIVAVDPDSNIDASGNNVVKYQIVSGNEDGKFILGSDTGYLSISDALDHEKQTNYSLNISAEDSGMPRMVSYQQLQIKVTDTNDNAPVFNKSVYQANVSENSAPQTPIIKIQALDADTGDNGALTYQIPNGIAGNMFTVDAQTGVLSTKVALDREVKDSYTNKLYVVQIPENRGQTSVLTLAASDRDLGENARITYAITDGNDGNFSIDPHHGDITTEPLDRETRSTYNLTITASDHGTNSQSATTIVIVTVLDENDNSPVFSELAYNTSVPENTKEGSVLLKVSANDPDLEQNGQVMYSLGNNTDGVFEINSTTGEITTSGVFDREKVANYSFLVVASDNGVFGPRNSTSHVFITITDINDNPPAFALVPYTVSLSPDPDFGSNGLIEYTLQANTGSNDIMQNNCVSCACSGVIEITVGTGDSNILQFSQPEYSVQIPENFGRGNSVINITASFVSASQPSQSTVYSFANGNENKAFRISNRTVKVSNFCMTGPFNVTVHTFSEIVILYNHALHSITLGRDVGYTVVTDGKPDHVRTTWLDIYVDDENDNPPVFSQSNYEVALPEQTGPQQSVITILASDADSGRNAKITYSMAPTAIDSFYINSQTGTIYTNRTIAFTSGQSIIQLVVVAKDNGTVVQSSMVSVHIQITDVNKFTPRFLGPPKYVAHIRESAQRGSEVLQVSAVDEDNSHRGDNINYTIIGPGSEIFLIRQRTGNIFVNGAIDFEVKKQYDLTAVATDRGIPPKNSSIAVTIFVDDENDNPPVYLEDKYSITLEENAEALKVFLFVNATDADSGVNAAIKYSITSGNSEGIFLNPHNEGGLMIMEGMHLDYESHQSHRLIIRAVDCNGCPPTTPRLSSFVTVDIIVTDVNEFKPRFPVKHYLEDILEGSEVGSVVFRMGLVTYSLMNEYDFDKFSIDTLTGEVSSKYVFDYEAEKALHLYNLTIIATDGGQYYDMADVTVRVVDRDEYDPVLAAEQYTFEVPGSAKAGHFIGQISASDRDGGEAGRLVYSFLEASEYFGINPFTGNISVIVTLHEDPPRPRQGTRQKRTLTTDQEILTIMVSSGQTGSRRDTAQCVITIDRLCPNCAAPLGSIVDKSDVEGGVLAGIILACIIVVVLIVLGILFLVYRRNNTGKSVPNYSSDSTLDLEPPPQLPYDRSGYADIIRINCPPANNQLVSDVSDQSHNSASSGRGSAEAEEEDEEISRINSNSFLHSSQAFRQKAMPDSGIQHDDETLSEPAVQTHQEYLANLGIDSSKIGKVKPVIRNNNIYSNSNNNSNNNKKLGRSAESMHQFSDEGGGEGGVDTDLEKLTDLETDDEAATLEVRTQGMSFHEPETHNLGSLSNVVNTEEVNGGSYNWDYLIDWGPQYQPLAHVFSEIAKLKDESVTPKKQPIKTVPQRQYSSSLKQPQVRTVPPPIITNAPPLSVPLTTNQNSDSLTYPHHSHAVRGNSHQLQHQGHQPQAHHHGLFHHNHSHHPSNVQQQMPKTSHIPQHHQLAQHPPAAHSSQMFSPHLCPFPNTRSPQQVRHQQFHTPRMGIHPHIHPPPPLLPPPPIPQQQTSSSGSRSHPNSTHASTMNISLPSLPRSPISYESSLTSAVMTPSLTPSLSPLATRSPSISPVVSSGHNTPGKSSSRQNLTQRSSKAQSMSSGSEREFTI
ncbi:unnamed protein product, partial [Candidula unifasciata]